MWAAKVRMANTVHSAGSVSPLRLRDITRRAAQLRGSWWTVGANSPAQQGSPLCPLKAAALQARQLRQPRQPQEPRNTRQLVCRCWGRTKSKACSLCVTHTSYSRLSRFLLNFSYTTGASTSRHSFQSPNLSYQGSRSVLNRSHRIYKHNGMSTRP